MKRLFALLFLLFAFPIFAATTSQETVFVVVTNAPTTNGQTLTIGSQTYIFTNTSAGSGFILTNTAIGGSATNIFNQVVSFPPIGGTLISRTNTNCVVLYLPIGTLASVSVSGGWGYVTAVTNSTTNAYNPRFPIEVFLPADRTNLSSLIVSAQSLYSTQAFGTNAAALGNFAPKTNAQLVTPTLTSAIVTNAQRVNTTNLVATTARIDGGSVSNVSILNATTIIGTAGAITGGMFQASMHTNASGTFTNIQSTNGSFASPTLYGALGSLLYPKLFMGSGGEFPLITNQYASGEANLMIDNADSGEASHIYFQFAGSWVWVLTASTNEFSIRYPSGTLLNAQLSGLTIGDGRPITVDGSIGGSILTNTLYRGTNTFNGEIVLTPRTHSGFGNGYNSGFSMRTNGFVRISGPTGAYTNSSFSGGYSGLHVRVEADNPGLSFTILHRSTIGAPSASEKVNTGTGALWNSTNNPATFELLHNGTEWLLWNPSKQN